MPARKPSTARLGVERLMPQIEPPPRIEIAGTEPELHQTAVWLSDEDTEFLDDLVRDLKRGGWRAVNRSVVVRSLIRAGYARPWGSLAGVQNADDLVRRISNTP